MSQSPEKEESAITAVLRAADVLSELAHAPDRLLGVSEMARSLNLSKAVVYRLLVSLRMKGLVEYDDDTRKYRLGHQALLLGSAFLDQMDFREMAHGLLVELCEATNETATLSVRTGWERVYVDQVTPKRDIRMVVPIGRPFPLHAGASSKALLAHLTDDEQQAYLSEQATLPAVTEHTITDPQRLRAELALIKERGYATSNGERQSGAASVAAPLLGRRGEPFAVISLCGPMERFGPHLDDASVRLLSAVRLAEKHARF